MFKRLKEQKGAIVVMAAVVTTAMLGFAALAVDVGMVLTARNQLQNAVDSASLASAPELMSDVVNQDAVIAVAIQYAGYHNVLDMPVTLTEQDIQILDNADKALRRVKITTTHTVDLLFA